MTSLQHPRVNKYALAIKWKYAKVYCFNDTGEIYIEEQKFTKEGFIDKFLITSVLVGFIFFFALIGINENDQRSSGLIDLLFQSFCGAVFWGAIIAAIVEFFVGKKKIIFTDKELDSIKNEYNQMQGINNKITNKELVERLRTYKKLLDDKEITIEEYELLKSKVIN